MKVKNVGNHAEDLADGRMLAPGEEAELTDEQADVEFNQGKISDGVFMDVTDVQPVPEEELGPLATDAARELAQQEDVELGLVTGTGASGRIIADDVEAYLAERGDQ